MTGQVSKYYENREWHHDLSFNSTAVDQSHKFRELLQFEIIRMGDFLNETNWSYLANEIRFYRVSYHQFFTVL